MAEAFESIINGKNNIVLLGEAGCGKSEIALNLAALLSEKNSVEFFDMDQTKPLYRSRDASAELESRGVMFHCERQFFDAPTLVGGVAESLAGRDRITILDVGGNDTGARMIGGFAGLLNKENSILLYVVNPYRPWSKDAVSIDCTLSAILNVSHMKKFHIIANPNLGPATTAKEFAAGMEKTKAMLEEYVPVKGACVREEIYESAAAATTLPLLPIKLYLKYEWDR